MASVSSLVDRVRFELGDGGKSFVEQFVADGTTNRFRIHYSPLDAHKVFASVNGVDVTDSVSVEESTGVIVFDSVPNDMDEITVSGFYYRYFTYEELVGIVESAVAQHTARHTDSVGRQITVDNLPMIDEYPVAVYATTLALYTLATDASFDIDISAPDGVNIPRSERYRQLMDMVTTRQNQYRELCVQLGLGMYTIDVFTFRRVSKGTNRYIPVYKPQEVDDRSYPERVHDNAPVYGDKPPVWPTNAGEFTAYQGRPFTIEVSFTHTPGTTLVAKLLNQRGSVVTVQDFEAVFVDAEDDGNYVATLSLTGDQTLRIPNRTYWSIQEVVEGDTNIEAEIKGGNFFTVRASTVVL